VDVSPVITELVDGVFRIVLNRPERGNAFDGAMVESIAKAFRQAADSKQSRLVFLTGAGKNFCTGADLRWMASAGKAGVDDGSQTSGGLHAMYAAILACEIPIVAKVHGRIYGGGVGLVAACDIVACASDAVFAVPEARLGLIPGVMTPLLMRRIGPGRFMEFALTGREISAEEAQRAGLVSFCGPQPDVDLYVERCRVQICENSAEAMRTIKKCVQMLSPVLAETLSTMASLTSRARSTDDAQARIKSFLERKPTRS